MRILHSSSHFTENPNPKMQSLSFRLTKRLYNSKPLFRISSNFVAHASSATSTPPPPPPPSPPIPAPSTLRNLLTAPWFATQSRGISLSGSDVSSSVFSHRCLLYTTLRSFLTYYYPRRFVAMYTSVMVLGSS